MGDYVDLPLACCVYLLLIGGQKDPYPNPVQNKKIFTQRE